MRDVRIVFVEQTRGPKGLICAAELYFDTGTMAGLKLTGFTVWRSSAGNTYVTGPTRGYGAGANRRNIDYVRSQAPNNWAAIRGLKAWIIDEFEKAQHAHVKNECERITTEVRDAAELHARDIQK